MTAADEQLDLFDVHGASPSPEVNVTQSTNHHTEVPSEANIPQQSTFKSSASTITMNHMNTNAATNSKVSVFGESTNHEITHEMKDTHSSSIIPKATALLRSISDKLPQQMNNLQSITIHKQSSAPFNPQPSSNASSPTPPNLKNLAVTLDKFSKEDLFKLFGKARKENRVIRQEVDALKAKNKDIYRALNASNEQNEVLQITNQHLREEYTTLKTKTSSQYNTYEEQLRSTKRENEEKISLIKTKCASYMDEVNRLNEQMEELKTENDVLSSANTSVESQIGDQYTQFVVQLTTLETQLEEKTKEKEIMDTKASEMKEEIAIYREQIGRYKDLARKAEANLERIGSLEEELREKIRDNHQLQIKTRSLNQTIKRITEKCDKQSEKIQESEAEHIQTQQELEALQKDHVSSKEHNQLLNEKLNILLKENADNTLKTEKKIERIEDYHLTKYKTLLNSFQMMKKRIEVNNRMNDGHQLNTNRNSNHSNSSSSLNSQRYSSASGYSNAGWKQYHGDHHPRFNFEEDNKNSKHLTYCIDLEMDEEQFMDNMNDLNSNINELTNNCTSYDSDPVHNSTKQMKIYQNQVKEYKSIIHSLQYQLKRSQKAIETERITNKKFQAQHKRLNKPKNINIDYLRNVLVKFLILSEYLTDDQIVLVPVLGSILNLSKTEKDMIDNSYNTNRYFMGTNTLFPDTATAKYSPQRRKKKKKKKDKRSLSQNNLIDI